MALTKEEVADKLEVYGGIYNVIDLNVFTSDDIEDQSLREAFKRLEQIYKPFKTVEGLVLEIVYRR